MKTHTLLLSFVISLWGTSVAAQDGGMPVADGGMAVADGGMPVADGGMPVADAGMPVADAGMPVADGGMPVADGGMPVADGGMPVADGGMPVADGGMPVADGGMAVADGGMPVDPCGGLSIQGECNGDVLRFCRDDTLVEYDCAEFPSPANCAQVSESWGFDCVVQNQASCTIVQDDGQVFNAFCEAGSGCFDDVCTPNVGVCEDSNNFAPVCNESQLTETCSEGQPAGITCPEGSTCTAGACTGIAEGGDCSASNLVCAEGLNCQAGICTTGGVAPLDAGTPNVADDDAGTEAPSAENKEDGCSATKIPSQKAPASFALLALWAVAFRRRKK